MTRERLFWIASVVSVIGWVIFAVAVSMPPPLVLLFGLPLAILWGFFGEDLLDRICDRFGWLEDLDD